MDLEKGEREMSEVCKCYLGINMRVKCVKKKAF